MEFLLLWVLSGNILDSGMRYEDAGSCYADAQNSGMELREIGLTPPKFTCVAVAKGKELKLVVPATPRSTSNIPTVTTYEALGNKDTRSEYGQGLAELGKSNPNVVALCADLTGSLKMNAFQDAHPGRFFQCRFHSLLEAAPRGALPAVVFLSFFAHFSFSFRRSTSRRLRRALA